MQEIDPVVIVSYSRTPIGRHMGILSEIPAWQLGSYCIKDCLNKITNDIKTITHISNNISQIIMGCVLSAGQGQAPARQAALASGLSNKIPCTTINKICGSGLQAIIMATDSIKAGSAEIVLAGGMENMSLAPFLLTKIRTGYKLGHREMYDHMMLDGLEDAYDKNKAMGVFAENTAQKYNFSRTEQDEFAINSLQKSYHAQTNDKFKPEICEIIDKIYNIKQDELPDLNKSLIKIPILKPAFVKDGTVTAANSSSISDGAACVLLMRLSKALELNLKPIVTIKDYVCYAHEPCWFTTAPAFAIKKLLQKNGTNISNIDLFEINEAFATVTMVAIKELSLDPNKVNIHGGACALGHPIGASGARITCTLLSALEQYQKKLGIASLCIGGGEAIAMLFEKIN